MATHTDIALTYPEFTPGTGMEPPYLAGRGTEQQTLLEPLARLRAGRGHHRDIVLIGPRGNGKTALMRWFERECEQALAVDVVWLTPDDIKGVDSLAPLLAPPEGWREFLPDEIELGPAALGKLKWQLGGETMMLTRLLQARCRKRPLVVLLDEAHALVPETGQTLLNVSQKVRAKAPFLLVLGGTPGLEQRLDEMKATFWSRSDILGIGRLDESGARDAIVKPFQQHGITVDEIVVARVIEDSQCYPYFLQCWGAALTKRLREREQDLNTALREIKGDMVDEARLEVGEERDRHYEIFRRQIEKAGLQPLAAIVTEAYIGADTLEEHELNATIRSYLKEIGKAWDDTIVFSLKEALAGFGYVWRPPTAKAIWHAGVPSLMTHVLNVELQERRHADEDSLAMEATPE